MPPRNARASQPFQESGVSFRRGLGWPAVRASLVLFSALFLYILYGRSHFYRDPNSIFFDESHAYERRYSALREKQARTWIEKQERLYPEHYSRDGPKTSAQNATICATILTTVRPGTKPYLDTTIATLLDKLTPEERSQLHLQVFFATSDPYSHQSYHHPWLRKVVDEVYTYEDILSPSEMTDIQELEAAGNNLHKSPYDYTIPLRQCYENSKARYIGMFEDDILLAEGWLSRTLLNLQEMETRMRARRKRGEWLYLRLFNQERSTGWVSRHAFGNEEHKYWAMFGVPIAVFMLAARRASRRWRYLMDNQTILVVTCFFTPLFIVVFFKTGKASLMPPASGLREEDFGCCAQGLVFNRFHVEHLSEYMLIRRNDGYHDNLLRDYARVFELARWSAYPMMIQHIGANSSIQLDPDEARRVWSMAFEDLSDRTLAREHKQMARLLFGPDAPRGLELLRPTPKPHTIPRPRDRDYDDPVEYDEEEEEEYDYEAEARARQDAEFEEYEMEREI